MTSTPRPGQTPSPARSKTRRTSSLIGSSPHRDEYVRLIEAGWTSVALERYASYRFGEEIAAGTFRTYKSRKKITVAPSVLLGSKQDVSAGESRVDVMGVREELVLLQMRRIAIDAKHEQDMSKLFSTTGKEIDMLARLLDQVKTDQQDYGLLPKVADRVEVTQPGPKPGEAPKHRTLGALLGLESDEDIASAARTLSQVIPITRRAGQNGHADVG